MPGVLTNLDHPLEAVGNVYSVRYVAQQKVKHFNIYKSHLGTSCRSSQTMKKKLTYCRKNTVTKR